jgi:hypothetical protein
MLALRIIANATDLVNPKVFWSQILAPTMAGAISALRPYVAAVRYVPGAMKFGTWNKLLFLSVRRGGMKLDGDFCIHVAGVDYGGRSNEQCLTASTGDTQNIEIQHAP